jgi:hypothetical protein
MQPIIFECTQLIPKAAPDICAQIADTDRWREFKGYGFLPGIKNAEYEKRTDDMLGSRIRVHNADGSAHVEEIYKWVPGQDVAMKISEFTPPLNNLAAYFTEEWAFQANNTGALVTRKFQLFPVRSSARPILWFISLFFKKAIERHLAEMASA